MKCTFSEFSKLVAPQLADLTFKATNKRQVLKHLYAIATEAELIEKRRVLILKEVKKVGPRLRKYGQLIKAIKNVQKYIAKSLALSAQLKSPSPSSHVKVHLEESKEMIDDALGIMEAARRYILVFEVPNYVKKKVAETRQRDRLKLMDELLGDDWRKARESLRGPLSLWEWFDTISGALPDSPPLLEMLQEVYALTHLRAQGATHWLIWEAESFLSKKTSAEPTVRLKIIHELIMATFKEDFDWKLSRIDTEVGRAYERRGMKRSKRPRVKNPA
jgi:hypothetical protein